MLLVLMRHIQHAGLIKIMADQLHADGPACGGKADRETHARQTGQIERHGVDVFQIHGDRIIGLGPQFKRRRRTGRSHDHINRLESFDKILLDQAAPLDLSPERTLEELATIAYGNLLDVAEWSPERGVRPLDSRTLTREQAAAIASIKQVIGRDGSVSWEVKMHDKTKPLELFMKHFGMLTEKVEITVDDTLASRIEAARRRAGLTAEERPALEHEG